MMHYSIIYLHYTFFNKLANIPNIVNNIKDYRVVDKLFDKNDGIDRIKI